MTPVLRSEYIPEARSRSPTRRSGLPRQRGNHLTAVELDHLPLIGGRRGDHDVGRTLRSELLDLPDVDLRVRANRPVLVDRLQRDLALSHLLYAEGVDLVEV